MYLFWCCLIYSIVVFVVRVDLDPNRKISPTLIYPSVIWKKYLQSGELVYAWRQIPKLSTLLVVQPYQVWWMLITGLLFSLPPNLSSLTIFSPLVLTELQYSGYLLGELLTQIIYVHFAKFVVSRCALCRGFSVPSIFLSWGEFNANHNFWTRLPSLAHKNKTENQWQRK